MKLVAPLVMLAAILAAAVVWDDTPPRADVVLVNRGDVFTLDPQRMSYVSDFRMAYALYEGVLRWNNVDLSIEPAAAGLPMISDDQLTYTFHIRPDAKWSNNDPVTAHDFVYSWKRLLWPDTAADYSNLFFVIEGAEEFFHWRNAQLAAFASGTKNSAAESAVQSQDLPLASGEGQGKGRIPNSRAANMVHEPLDQHSHILENVRMSSKRSSSDLGPAAALFDQAQRRFEQTVGIKAIDDRTLQIKLRRPTAYFLDLLCFAVCYPVHRPTVEGWPEETANSAAIRKRGWIGVQAPAWADRRFVKLNSATGRIEQEHQWARPTTLVTNGPYVLAEWRYKRDLRLERNPHFHSPHIVRNNSVLLLCIEDPNTSVLAYESGKVDWLVEVGAEYQADMFEQRRQYDERHQSEINSMLAAGKSIDEALAALPPPGNKERRNVHARPTFGTDFYSFNCRELLADGRANPFADARVRRAFAMSVDKSAIVRAATRLNEPIAGSLTPRDSIPDYRSPDGLPFDVDAARSELAAAGWIDRNNDGLVENEQGEPFPVIDLLWTTNSSRYKWMSLELKAQWERELGVKVEMRGADTKFYKEDLKLGKFMIARGRWYGDYGDPTTFLDINKTGDGNNDRGFSSAAFDAMLEAAANEREADKRLRILEEAERFLFEQELPLVPICQLVQLYMYEPGRVQGLTSHPRLIQYLWKIEVK